MRPRTGAPHDRRRRGRLVGRGSALVPALLLALAAAGPARAQDAETPVRDVPAGEGTIRGSVVHASSGSDAALADLPVLLYALPSGDAPGLRSGRTDDLGRFVFEGVSTAPDTAYMVGTRYREVPFAARTRFAPGESELAVEISVSDPTSDATGVSVREAEVALDWVGAYLRVIEVRRLENPTPNVVFVPEAERAGREPLLRLLLPEGAENLNLAFGLEGLERDGRQLDFWGPLYPGPYDVRLSYVVPAEVGEGTLRLSLLSGAEAVRVLVPEGGLEVSAPDLAAGEPSERDGRTFQTLAGGRREPGDTLELALRVPELRIDPDALQMAEVRMWLELDDAALVVDEEHHFEVTGSTPVAGTREQPLLRIDIPEDAELRMLSEQAERLGLVAAPDGGLMLLGPVPPGESSIGLRYRLRAPGPGGLLPLRRSFEADVPLLRVLVADTGVRLESDRLHRRRPIRSGTRTYLQLEAFYVDAGDPADVRIGRLERGTGPSTRTAAALVLGTATLAIWFVAAPLRARRRAVRAADADVGSAVARRERDAVYDAIRDLDHDFETGKLSDADYRQMRGELRARAVELMRRDRQVLAAATTPTGSPRADEPAAAKPAARFCTDCGGALDPGWSFCAQCGAALEASGPEGA